MTPNQITIVDHPLLNKSMDLNSTIYLKDNFSNSTFQINTQKTAQNIQIHKEDPYYTLGKVARSFIDSIFNYFKFTADNTENKTLEENKTEELKVNLSNFSIHSMDPQYSISQKNKNHIFGLIKDAISDIVKNEYSKKVIKYTLDHPEIKFNIFIEREDISLGYYYHASYYYNEKDSFISITITSDLIEEMQKEEKIYNALRQEISRQMLHESLHAYASKKRKENFNYIFGKDLNNLFSQELNDIFGINLHNVLREYKYNTIVENSNPFTKVHEALEHRTLSQKCIEKITNCNDKEVVESLEDGSKYYMREEFQGDESMNQRGVKALKINENHNRLYTYADNGKTKCLEKKESFFRGMESSVSLVHRLLHSMRAHFDKKITNGEIKHENIYFAPDVESAETFAYLGSLYPNQLEKFCQDYLKHLDKSLK